MTPGLNGTHQKFIQIFYEKLIENRPPRSLGLTGEYNIRTGKGSRDIKMWIKLVQNRVRW
jgi:hypothetical protein